MQFFLFVIGACFGSFVNVLIYRVPRGLDFVKGVSACPFCGKRIAPFDLVPVVSYLLLLGKCRGCKGRISLKYPAVELLSGALAVSAAFFYGYTAAAAAVFGIWLVLMAISFIDVEHMVIPDGLLIALFVLCAVFLGMRFFEINWLSHIIGFFAVSVPMLALALLIKDAFGGGDIKLMAVCGLLLGWQLALFALFVAVMLGGSQGIYVKYIKRAPVRHIAFGQYLCIGVAAAMMFGEGFLRWYLGLILT
jgi:leader peptidase (prepilin peptidase)/N-methyltransferase